MSKTAAFGVPPATARPVVVPFATAAALVSLAVVTTAVSVAALAGPHGSTRVSPPLTGGTATRPDLLSIVPVGTVSGTTPTLIATSPPATQLKSPQMPVTFEANVGQSPSDAPFIVHTAGTVMALSPTRLATTVEAGDATARLTLDLVGGRAGATMAGVDRRPGTVNYFIGNDPAGWRTGVPTFGSVAARNVYPGVDVSWYASSAGAEYDLTVAPGADPSVIAWHVAGATSVSVNSTGDLVVHTPAGDLTQQAPQAYQQVNGLRHMVPSHFMVRGDEVRFALGGYDRSRPLVIDPTLAYSTYLGGKRDDVAEGLGVDAQGNAYVAGFTASDNFPVTRGAFQAARGSTGDVSFVAKFNSARALVYATYVGGSSTQEIRLHNLAVDAAGDAFIVGMTRSPDYPTTPGSFQSSCAGCGRQPFLSELDPTGTRLLYSTILDGPDGADALASTVALGSSGTVYVAGFTNAVNSANTFPTTPGAFQTGTSGQSDGFVMKVDPSLPGDGSGVISASNRQVVYSSYLGPLGPSSGYGGIDDLAVDAQGNAYLAGFTYSASFPTTAGSFQGPPPSGFTGTNPASAFVSKLSPSGQGAADLVYSTFLDGATANTSGAPAGTALDIANGIALGPSLTPGGTPTIDVVGSTGATDFPVTTTGVDTTPSICSPDGGFCDAFYVRLNPAGAGSSDMVYGTLLGGDNVDAAYGVADDSAGHVNIAGTTASYNFPTMNPVQAQKCCPSSAFNDVFVAVIDPSNAGASGLLFSTFLGGTGGDYANAIALDGHGDALIAGYTDSPGAKQHAAQKFPVTKGSAQARLGGRTDAFFSVIGGV